MLALGIGGGSKNTRTFRLPHFGHFSRLDSSLIGKRSPRVQTSVVMSRAMRVVRLPGPTRTHRALAFQPSFQASPSVPTVLAGFDPSGRFCAVAGFQI